MDPLPQVASHRERGVALIIVLAFIVLLTGLAVAYFSRTVTDRQISQGSFNQSKASQVAASATDLIIGELRQEIANGSTSPAPIFGSTTVYTPTTNAYMVPRTSGTPSSGATIPNLIRCSVANDAIAPPGGSKSRILIEFGSIALIGGGQEGRCYFGPVE